MNDALLHKDVAAHAAGVSVSTVAMWATRGWTDPTNGQHRTLPVADRDWRGRPLYRYLDVMAAEQATRRRGRKRNPNWAALNTNSTGLPTAS